MNPAEAWLKEGQIITTEIELRCVGCHWGFTVVLPPWGIGVDMEVPCKQCGATNELRWNDGEAQSNVPPGHGGAGLS